MMVRTDEVIRELREAGAADTHTFADDQERHYVQFPVEDLPKCICEFVHIGADSIGCDPAMIAVPMLSVLASAVGNSHTIRLKQGWDEPPILWTAIVGESGNYKSPALGLVMRPISRIQLRERAAYREASDAYKLEKEIYTKDFKNWQKSKDQSDPPKEPICPTEKRLFANDTTIETMGILLKENPRGLLLYRDELAAWFGSFDQYRAGKGNDAARWIEMYGAQFVNIDRKTTNPPRISIPRASVSIAGGIQPGILQRHLQGEHLESGLAARLLFAMPPRRRKRWNDSRIPRAAEDAIQSVIESLRALELRMTHDGEPVPAPLTLAPSAQAAWEEYYNEHAEELHNLDGYMASVWSKLEATTARIALVHQLTSFVAGEAPSRDEIDLASMLSAIRISHWFGNESMRINDLIKDTSPDSETGKCAKLIQLITEKGGCITSNALCKSSRAYKSSNEAEAALDELADLGHGSWRVKHQGMRGGRPTRVFHLHEAVPVTETHPQSSESEVS